MTIKEPNGIHEDVRRNAERFESTIDDLADRIAHGIQETRATLDAPLHEAEELVKNLRETFMTTTRQAESLADQFDRIYDQFQDPINKIRRDPKLAIGALALFGIAFGLLSKRRNQSTGFLRRIGGRQ